MNNFRGLIKDLSPDGVPMRRLGDLVKRNTGMQVTATEMKRMTLDGKVGNIRIFAGGATFVDTVSGLVPPASLLSGPLVIVKSRGNIGFEFWKGKCSHKSELWSYSPQSKELDIKFLYYFLTTQRASLDQLARSKSVKMPQLAVGDTDNLMVPLPHIEIQREVVSILDKFTELDAELDAELESRRKQYEQYRNKLLSTHLPNDVEFKSLRELLGPITRGKRLTKTNLAEDGSIPVFHGGLNPIGYHDKSNTPGETVMVINTGASSGSVGWATTPFWCSDGCFALPQSKEFSSRYIYHYASLKEQFFMDKVRKAGIPTLAAESVYSLPIPVLPMAKQLEIVETLDAFLELTSNHSIGVPAEITARRKQYEHYRNKLLTFKELKAS